MIACERPAPEEVEPSWELVASDPADQPIADLPAEWLARFADGDAFFDEPLRESQGLGPAYVRTACAGCHADDGRGPGTVRKMVVVDGDGEPLADQVALPWGHTERPYVAGGATTPLVPPDGVPGLVVTVRAPPPVFGRGYVDAVADGEILRVEAEQAARGDAIAGRANRVPYQSVRDPAEEFHALALGDLAIGRFGLKARIATADDFAADAYQGDMSITSALRPDELPNPDALADDLVDGPDIEVDRVQRTADYVRMLAIPARPSDPDGAALFAEVGCDVCHVPTLRTRADYPIAALADVDAPLYSDLLLHDMGAARADGLVEFDAGPRDWKTPPLVGLRFQPTFLHDGSALTVEAAIEAHGDPDSESVESAEAFAALPPADRARLLAFVQSL